ncbi:phospholipase D-like domain-containing protein [Paenibacillus lautus]|uniref:phospholipase D-like domain-containing protein n=1 Tax=Paenibacillus lautus TaxID=1401 RepID=UPI001BCDE9A4|nr:phospholipase D-like domain-containing protein [Paenibacillus lautus]
MRRRMTYLILLFAISAVAAGCSLTEGDMDGLSNGEKGNESTENASFEKRTTQARVDTYFTREEDHPEEAMIRLIEEAQSTLDIAIYSINYEPIVDAVIDAAKRGVHVRLITDATHAEEKGKQAKALENIRSAGIPVKVNAHNGKMHLKMMIADGTKVEMGSFNYLQSAVEENDDVAVIIQDEATGASFESAFNNMWNDGEAFKDYGL